MPIVRHHTLLADGGHCVQAGKDESDSQKIYRHAVGQSMTRQLVYCDRVWTDCTERTLRVQTALGLH